MSEKRNIVLITLDSLRADHCSFMGHQRKTTPTIDKMARNGLYFENAIASGVATPTSTFGVFTGEYPLANYEVGNLNGNEWRKEIRYKKTLAQVLREKGYFTGAVHANPAASSFFGFNKGFEYFQDFLKDENQNDLLAKLFNKIKLGSFYENVRAVLKRESTSTDWKKLIPEIINFRKKANRKPYFLWILLLDTHIPYIPPREFRKWNTGNTIRLIYLNWKVRKNYLNPANISEFDKEQIINAYDSSILYADSFIEYLWDMLKDDDPIFIIYGDHGEGFGEHEFFYHPAMLYEELIHVPLVIYNADIKGKVEEPVSLLGLAPSILELIGEENEFPSESILHGNEKEWVISKVFEKGQRKVAVRMKDWKFIIGQKEENELYNLKNDPYEQENLINKYPDLAREMERIVKIHVKQEMEKNRIKNKIWREKFRWAK